MVCLKRREDWPQRLVEAVKEKADTRFSPGNHDCCISACDIVLRMTGTDIAKHFRGYRGKKEMLATLEEHGGVEAIAESVMAENGCEEIPTALASRGDMVMLDMPSGPTMAVVYTDGVHAIACGMRGSGQVSIKAHATRAWRIG